MKKYIIIPILFLVQFCFAQTNPDDYKNRSWGHWAKDSFFIYPNYPLSEEIIVDSGDIIAARSSNSINKLAKFSLINQYIAELYITEVIFGKIKDCKEEYDIRISVGETRIIVTQLIGEEKSNSILSVTFESFDAENGKAKLKISQEEF